MFVIVWEFQIALQKRAEFLAIYGPQGEWARLFGRAAGYLGTELLQSSSSAARFLTLDRWAGEEDYNSFRQQWAIEYATLDQRCQELIVNERAQGTFVQIPPRTT